MISTAQTNLKICSYTDKMYHNCITGELKFVANDSDSKQWSIVKATDMQQSKDIVSFVHGSNESSFGYVN